jgi:hypothetical protein
MDGQTIVVTLLVLAAGGYVVRWSWQTLQPPQKGVGCGGGCSACPQGKPQSEGVTLVPLEVLHTPSSAPRST